MTLTQGQIVGGRYRIVSLLGHGGMGAVYHAWDTRLNVLVALKEMAPQPGLDPHTLAQLRQQFQREATVLARLNHPHLVDVTDFFEEGGNAYLVMKFIEGESLADRIVQKGMLPESQVLVWAGQLLDALAYYHRQGIIHRDIKPQNIVITPEGQAVLVDFGLVKLWDPQDPYTRTVMRGAGTPEYAPPEQYDTGLGHTDPRSDIYSLGATLYHALTGQAPPTATQRMADPPSLKAPRILNTSLSMRTEQVVLKAMEPRPDHRFESAHEVALALSKRPSVPTHSTASKQQPKMKSKMQPPARMQRKHTSGRSLVLGSLSVLMLLLLGSAVILWWQARKGQGPLAPFLDTHMQIVWSPDGQWLVAASSLGISLRNTQTFSEERLLETKAPVSSIAFTDDGAILASGLWNNTVQVWRASDGALLHTLEGHTSGVKSVAFSPDGTTLASGILDGTVQLWRTSDASLLRILGENAVWTVECVAFSPDGITLVSGSNDGVKLWQVADGTLLRTLEHTSGVKSVSFSPNGMTLASGSNDGVVRLWQVANGALVHTLEGRASAVKSVSFSPNGERLAVGYFDGTVLVFGVTEE